MRAANRERAVSEIVLVLVRLKVCRGELQLPIVEHADVTKQRKHNMSNTEEPKKERFAPKEPVILNPPKDDVISREHLAKCDGELPHQRLWRRQH